MILGLVESPRIEVDIAESAAQRHRARVELESGVCLDKRLFQPFLRSEKKCIPLMRRRIPRVELDRATELGAGSLPVPIVDEEAPRQRRVSLGQSVIELECRSGVLLRFRKALVYLDVPVVHVERIRIGETSVCERVPWIGLDCLL